MCEKGCAGKLENREIEGWKRELREIKIVRDVCDGKREKESKLINTSSCIIITVAIIIII